MVIRYKCHEDLQSSFDDLTEWAGVNKEKMVTMEGTEGISKGQQDVS
jgi:hypothetical protein